MGHVAGASGLNGVPLPANREWSVDVADVPDVSGMLAAAARARAAGAEVVVASLRCCLECEPDLTEAQVEAVRALLSSPDVDLVLGHHADVVQPFERIAGEWAAYGLGSHVAQHATHGHPTEDSVFVRFPHPRRRPVHRARGRGGPAVDRAGRAAGHGATGRPGDLRARRRRPRPAGSGGRGLGRRSRPSRVRGQGRSAH